MIQAVGGLMSITGATDADGGEPTKVGVAISDVVTGLFGTVSVLAGLLARAGEPGVGQRIDVSLLESTLAVLVNQAQNAFVGGNAPQRMGNAHPNLVPYETFRTADGELAVAVGSERQWPRLCEALGLPGLAADPWYATNGDRVVHRADLRPILASRFASHATADWAAILDRADIPWGPINDVTAAFATPQAVAREMVVEVEHPVLGAVRQVGLPFRLSATPASIRSAPPLLGEHAAGDPRGARLRPGGRGHAPRPRRHLSAEGLTVPARPMITYPTQRLLAVIDDPARAREAATALSEAGVAPGDVEVLAGTDGRAQLAALGSRPNPLSRLVRAFQFLSMDQLPDFLVYERAIDDGRAVVAVQA